jgi:nucleoside transporter
MATESNATAAAPPLAGGLRFHLSAMMFLEFAIWGAWFVLLANYLGTLGFSGEQIGLVYSTFPLGAVIAPLIIGQLADRYFASEKLLGVLHIAGGLVLCVLANVEAYPSFFAVLLAYSLLYNPTLALTNAIAFTHIPDATRDFPGIRVLGTIGWIAVNVAYMAIIEPRAEVSNFPIYLAAGLSFVTGVYSFALPHTPPKGKRGEKFPFLRAIGLFREPSFAVFFVVSFLITIALAFYYSFLGPFLQSENGVGVEARMVGPLSTIGQLAEMILLPFLPFFIRRVGMKWVLVLGMAAWALRYGLFSLGEPLWIVILAILLHGICFDFFFAAGFIHVDNNAPTEIRGSAQALFTFLTYGLGLWLGFMASGWVAGKYTDEVTKVTDWSGYWLVPCIGAAVCLVAFAVLFRRRGGGAGDAVAVGAA